MIIFARPPQAVCCANANSCVIWNECVSPGSSVYDVDGDEDTDYCVNNGGNGEWADCGSDSNCAANEWCNTGTKDCVNDLGLCSATACNRDAQCLGSLKCINNKCRVAETEAGLCSNGIDDDCDGKTDCDDTDCCGGEGASCTQDSQCCGAMPCDNPIENAGTKCGCPTGFTWWGPPTNQCLFSEADCTAPPSNCDTNPFQVGCLRYSNTEACCVFGSYGGTTYYDWDVDHITTY